MENQDLLLPLVARVAKDALIHALRTLAPVSATRETCVKLSRELAVNTSVNVITIIILLITGPKAARNV